MAKDPRNVVSLPFAETISCLLQNVVCLFYCVAGKVNSRVISLIEATRCPTFKTPRSMSSIIECTIDDILGSSNRDQSDFDQ